MTGVGAAAGRSLIGFLPALLLLGCAGAAPTGGKGDLHDMPVRTIAGEETWGGRVEIDRIVVVRRGGHLRILPGTKVLFRRVDWDGDGVGDAEITVEGRLTAEGTREAPILFASAEAEPAPSDWKYLHVNFAEGASLSHVRASHAFSGLQVHYSQAAVRASEFRHNVDGIRFSTADLTVEDSWSRQNRHGVRFEERGHPAVLRRNEISGNDVGVFAVTQCLGKSVFAENNIRDNGTEVKMGLEQRADLPFGRNYWGPDPEAALAAFLDRRADPDLGRALTDPVLAAPVDVPRPFPIPDDPDWRRTTGKDD